MKLKNIDRIKDKKKLIGSRTTRNLDQIKDYMNLDWIIGHTKLY